MLHAKRVREEENGEEERQRLPSRMVARARGASAEQQEGQEVRRRSHEGWSGKKMPVSLGAGDAEKAVGPATGKTQRRQQLAVCASDVRQGKSEQQGQARAASSRERTPSGKESKGAEVQAAEAHLEL